MADQAGPTAIGRHAGGGLAGVGHGPMDGESMLPQFDQGAFPDRPRFAENQLGSGCVSMVREDGYKVISTGPVKEFGEDEVIYGPDHHQLAVFDLKADPYEYVNLIDTDEGQEVLKWAIEEHASLKTVF